MSAGVSHVCVSQIVTQPRYDTGMKSQTLSSSASCPDCGNGEARVRVDARSERIAITCTCCGRTDIRALDPSWSMETQRAAAMQGVQLRFVEPR